MRRVPTSLPFLVMAVDALQDVPQEEKIEHFVVCHAGQGHKADPEYLLVAVWHRSESGPGSYERMSGAGPVVYQPRKFGSGSATPEEDLRTPHVPQGGRAPSIFRLGRCLVGMDLLSHPMYGDVDGASYTKSTSGFAFTCSPIVGFQGSLHRRPKSWTHVINPVQSLVFTHFLFDLAPIALSSLRASGRHAVRPAHSRRHGVHQGRQSSKRA